VILTARAFATTLSALAATTVTAGALAAQLVPTTGRHLQNSARVGVGYVVSVPNMFVGFSVLGLTPEILGGVGVYADVKASTSSPGSDPYLLDDVTTEQAELTFGDFRFQEESSYLSVNLALLWAFRPELGVYGGAGYTREDRYHEYYDNSETRGNFGFYWVSDPDGSGNRVNLLGGVFFRFGNRVLFQVGLENQPLGVTAGALLTFPL
jgi:hypothetical protein